MYGKQQMIISLYTLMCAMTVVIYMKIHKFNVVKIYFKSNKVLSPCLICIEDVSISSEDAHIISLIKINK